MTANGAAAAVGTLLTILANQELNADDYGDRDRIEQMRGTR